MAEGALIRAKLGTEWDQVHPDVQARFFQNALPGQPLQYEGVMTIMKCSFIGMILARICLLFTNGALCPYQGKDIRAEIDVFTQPGSTDIIKTRHYFFSNKAYIFSSHMRQDTNGDLLEYVSKSIGMKINVKSNMGNLHFTDGGYFIEFGKLRIMLPLFFSPGALELHHINIDPNRFRIRIDITHPLFGRMYEQEGIFWFKGHG
jgi:hypothetical protein